MEIQELVENRMLPPLLTVAVAVKGTKNSKYAVKWALEKFVPKGRIFFRILHIRSKITMVPTPMGNFLPISKVREDVVSAYRKEVEWKTSAMLLPYQQMCARRQVEAEVVVIEADDVADAISGEIAKFSIRNLVIGASTRSTLTRKFKGGQLSARVSTCTPSFCMVYVVSEGKLSSVRASMPAEGESTKVERSNSSIACNSFSSQTFSGQSEWAETDSSSNTPHFSSPLSVQHIRALKTVNKIFLKMRSSPGGIHHCRSLSLNIVENARSSANYSEILCGSTPSSYRSFQMDCPSWNCDPVSTSGNLIDSSIAANQVDISFELERLRIELRNLHGMCEIAQNETADASRQLNDLSQRHKAGSHKLEEINCQEEKARELSRQEKERRAAAEKEAGIVRECAEKEIVRRKHAENSVTHDFEEKQRLERTLSSIDQQYKKFTWEEMVSATSSLSDTLMIGKGANGAVYKGILHHTAVAIKILHSDEGYRTKQFKQELEILGSIHHPHLLLLLGACPDHGCLVYEYMENGSLDDRLHRKNNTPSIPWFNRYRIAWEVASALGFLHNSKLKPIVHRDLKPANILLDHNYMSKIGDVGLSTSLSMVNSSTSTMYKDTAPAGTLCYIDPEYQRTGSVSPKSDVYALGMVILQLLTAKPPMGLTHIVETALQDSCLVDVLDSGAGEWPVEETKELALLGLSCAEMRRKDRPDLQDEVLPVLERLKGIADKAIDLIQSAPCIPPGHFICPILQDVMDDPCVAADGYTYSRRAIEKWFTLNDKSPMTNLDLPDKNLIPNHSLVSAIKDWKSRKQWQQTTVASSSMAKST